MGPPVQVCGRYRLTTSLETRFDGNVYIGEFENSYQTATADLSHTTQANNKLVCRRRPRDRTGSSCQTGRPNTLQTLWFPFPYVCFCVLRIMHRRRYQLKCQHCYMNQSSLKSSMQRVRVTSPCIGPTSDSSGGWCSAQACGPTFFILEVTRHVLTATWSQKNLAQTWLTFWKHVAGSSPCQQQ